MLFILFFFFLIIRVRDQRITGLPFLDLRFFIKDYLVFYIFFYILYLVTENLSKFCHNIPQ